MTHPIPSSNSGELRQLAELVGAENVLIADQDPFIELWEADANRLAAAMSSSATLIEHLEHEKAELRRQLEVAREALTRISDSGGHGHCGKCGKPCNGYTDGCCDGCYWEPDDPEDIARQALSNISGQG